MPNSAISATKAPRSRIWIRMATLPRSNRLRLDLARERQRRALADPRLFLGERKDPPARLDLVGKVAQHLNLDAHPLSGARLHPRRGAALRGLGGDVGYVDGNDHGRHPALALTAPPEVHDEARTVFAQDLLHPANGVAVAIEQETDAAQERHILGAVIAPAPAPLHGFELCELALPEAQHVLRDRQFFCNFADGAKRLGRLVHPSSSPAIKSRRYAYSAAFLRDSASLMRCFMMLLARNTSTRRGVIGTSWPVLGLRPMRCPLSRIPNDPNEDNFTVSPRSRLAMISRSTSSTISADSLRGRPTFWNTASAKSARVSVFPLIATLPQSRDYSRC